MKTLTLLYHDVIPDGCFNASGFSGADADVYKLDRSQFADHLARVSERVSAGSRPRATELTARSTNPSVLLTFDDGGVSALEHTALLLEQYGWRGHFFITTGKTGQVGFLDSRQIRELHQRGHLIGSHSVTHPTRMSHCSPDQLRHEWRESTRQLADITGAEVLIASVPGGYYSPRVAEAAAEAGVRVLFHSEPVSYRRECNGCLLLGRYSIQRHTPPGTAAAIAAGDWLPRFRQAAFWNTKKMLKAVGGQHWLTLRKKIFAYTKRDGTGGSGPLIVTSKTEGASLYKSESKHARGTAR